MDDTKKDVIYELGRATSSWQADLAIEEFK